MKEQEFIKILQERAQEQKKMMEAIPLPEVFQTVNMWLGMHPWRILIPISLILSLLFHIVMDKTYDDVILKIFGGFGLVHL